MDQLSPTFPLDDFVYDAYRKPPKQLIRPLISLLGDEALLCGLSEVERSETAATWTLTVVTSTRIIRVEGSAEDPEWNGFYYDNPQRSRHEERAAEADATSLSARSWPLRDISAVEVTTVHLMPRNELDDDPHWRPALTLSIAGEQIALPIGDDNVKEHRERADTLIDAVRRSTYSADRRATTVAPDTE